MSCYDEDKKRIEYIKGSDKTFTIKAEFSPSGEPKDLSSFVGASGTGLQLRMQGETGVVTLNLDASTEGRLSVVSAASGLAGKVLVSIEDTSTLLAGKKQNMELVITEGAQVSCIRFEKSLDVLAKLF